MVGRPCLGIDTGHLRTIATNLNHRICFAKYSPAHCTQGAPAEGVIEESVSAGNSLLEAHLTMLARMV